MVRAIVGTLIKVGKKEMEVQDIRKVIDSKNRSVAGESVAACGLYLTEVIYPYLSLEK
jgi:tRNA pseudouridine38-40 synthase